MMNRMFCTMLFLWCAVVSAPADQQAEQQVDLRAVPATLVIDASALTQARAAYAADAPAYRAVFSRLRSDAGKAMKFEPVSVMQKQQLPPSGDKHDYMSMGKYWWPDPSGDKSKPYIRRDGEANPEARDFPDHDNFALMVRAVRILSIEHFLSETPACAEHAAKLLRALPSSGSSASARFHSAIAASTASIISSGSRAETGR